MKAFIALLFMLSVAPGYSQTFDLLRQIQFSHHSGGIGFGVIPGGSVEAPSKIGFNAMGDIYIIDNFNRCINIYDPNMVLLSCVDLSGFLDMAEARTVGVCENGNILNMFAYLRCATPQGKEVYSFNPVVNGVAEDFDYYRVWVIGNIVLFYDRGKTPVLIGPEGNVLDQPKAKEMIAEWRRASPVRKGLKDASVLDRFLEDNELVLVGNRLYTEDTYLLGDYLRILFENTTSKDAREPFDLRLFRNETDFRGSGNFVYFGFDAHDNYYLNLFEKNGPPWLIVLDAKGSMLAKIYWPSLSKASFFDVSPNGDVYTYITDLDNGTITFYRMKNTWDPIQLSQASAPGQASAIISSLSASSTQTEPTDKNAYHPVKLFDGDPKTMWIENAPGPGIGESVTVGFAQPVTVDEIQFEPGCFWPEYWKQNYRVKQLEVKLDDKTFTANFNDQMVVQSLKLPSAVTFTTAVFTIKDVYPTTKWEDTAISEIAFYNQGAKIEVDSGKYADFLKKAP